MQTKINFKDYLSSFIFFIIAALAFGAITFAPFLMIGMGGDGPRDYIYEFAYFLFVVGIAAIPASRMIKKDYGSKSGRNAYMSFVLIAISLLVTFIVAMGFVYGFDKLFPSTSTTKNTQTQQNSCNKCISNWGTEEICKNECAGLIPTISTQR